MNRTVIPRTHQDQEKPEVYRCPRKISDIVYEAWNQLAHKAKLTEGTAVFSHRMIREEALTREDLLELKAIMTDSENPTTEISSQILGSRHTIAWIDSILHPGSKV
jgi:hypothetical protein